MPSQQQDMHIRKIGEKIMKFEKLIIHEVNWPHTNLIIISSSAYPELGLLAFGERERGKEIGIYIPGFVKPLNLSMPCGCCIPHLVGTGAEEDTDEAEKLRRDFITALRSCCKKHSITLLLFLEYYGDLLWMEQDKDDLHLVDPYLSSDDIDRAHFKAAFSEMRLNIPGFRPEDLAKY